MVTSTYVTVAADWPYETALYYSLVPQPRDCVIKARSHQSCAPTLLGRPLSSFSSIKVLEAVSMVESPDNIQVNGSVGLEARTAQRCEYLGSLT